MSTDKSKNKKNLQKKKEFLPTVLFGFLLICLHLRPSAANKSFFHFIQI